MDNYIECNVVMLHTEGGTNVFEREPGKLFHSIGIKPQTGISVNSSVKGVNIYFISNEEIKAGNWKYCGNTHTVLNAHKINSAFICKDCRKVVATTDPSLGLPAIPEQFLRQYVDAQGSITKVRLEMTNMDYVWHPMHRYSKDGYVDWIDPKIKLTEANEVIILEENKSVQALERAAEIIESAIIELEKRAHYENPREGYHRNNKWVAELVEFYIAGANWQKEQSANEAIEFVNWCEDHYWPASVRDKWRADLESDELLTTKQLYGLWQKSKE